MISGLDTTKAASIDGPYGKIELLQKKSLLQLIALFTDIFLDSTNNLKKISPSLSSSHYTSDSRAIKIIKPIVYGSRDLTFIGIYYSDYMVSCCIKATLSPYILSFDHCGIFN